MLLGLAKLTVLEFSGTLCAFSVVEVEMSVISDSAVVVTEPKPFAGPPKLLLSSFIEEH